jgi:hypothetical protein
VVSRLLARADRDTGMSIHLELNLHWDLYHVSRTKER